VLRELGYSAGRRSGPGVEWAKAVDSGRFSFGIAAGPWDEITGSRLTVTFGGDVLDLFYALFLEHLPLSVHPEWQAVTRSIFDRALGRDDAVHDDNLVEVRHLLLQQELDGLDAGYLDAFGWPWFDEQDLTRWWEFISRHFATGEASAIADASRAGPAAGSGDGRRGPGARRGRGPHRHLAPTGAEAAAPRRAAGGVLGTGGSRAGPATDRVSGSSGSPRDAVTAAAPPCFHAAMTLAPRPRAGHLAPEGGGGLGWPGPPSPGDGGLGWPGGPTGEE
jgi:hypothetical protein